MLLVLKHVKELRKKTLRNGGFPLAFPLPSLLASIEDLLVEVEWLEGMILVTESQKATFVSITQVNPVLTRLRTRPGGLDVAEKLSSSLFKAQGKRTSKPVLVFQGDGRFWLGIIGPRLSRSHPHRQRAISHLYRCYAKS